jgi:hypothetical protein
LVIDADSGIVHVLFVTPLDKSTKDVMFPLSILLFPDAAATASENSLASGLIYYFSHERNPNNIESDTRV